MAKVAVVGLGQRGLQHLNALNQLQEAEVVALCDPHPDNLREEKLQQYVENFNLGDIYTCDSFQSMLQATPLDAVYFAIPPSRHNGEVISAAQAGLHVLAEKPVSLYFDEALEMDRAIRASNIVACSGFQLRHDLRNLQIRDFLADKDLVMANWLINEPLEGHNVKHTRTEELGGPDNRIWTANRAWSGSSVVEAGIHPVDLMRFWAGEVIWTRADYAERDTGDIFAGGDNPNAYSVTFGFENGLIYNLLISRLRKTFYSDSYQSIIWDRGHLRWENDNLIAYYYEGSYPPTIGPDVKSLRHPFPEPNRGDATLALSRSFLRAVHERDESHLLNTFSSSLNSHAAVLAANASHELDGRKIRLDEFSASDEYSRFRKKPIT